MQLMALVSYLQYFFLTQVAANQYSMIDQSLLTITVRKFARSQSEARSTNCPDILRYQVTDLIWHHIMVTLK